ncbi:hypothetical protein E3N88_31963 [Mikania micrantha]|uniref:SHSP domain-containing protein n=1 Tax=Mikania micrantha TaxID=192012 RepID=A0A5N6M748_9ASTR|nr:hypothetical protein E3N88_31963 [Mikania micrantha]
MSIIPSIFGGRRSSIFDPFSLDIWDPFREFPIPSSSDLSNETSALVNARVDWKETPEAHIFKADLPGIKKEELKVEVEDGNVLQIFGERNVEKEDKNDKWHRVERSSGRFTRRFRLPENAKMEEVKAAMENGVLTITVPKTEAKKTDVKSVEIKSLESYIQVLIDVLTAETRQNRVTPLVSVYEESCYRKISSEFL